MTSTLVTIPRHHHRPVTPDIFDAILDAVRTEVLGRDAEIRAVMLALIARQHVFALSRPGEAKTMMTDRILVRIAGARRFSCQLDPFSGDDTLFGNWSVKSLAEDDEYRRSAKNNAIQFCDVAEVDEIARGSAATIASLLRIANERQYMDAGEWVTADLSTILCSANSLPWVGAGADRDKAADLAAFWDRVAIRLWMPPTTDLDVMRAILDLPTPDPQPRQVLDWNDVTAAQQAAAELPVSPEARTGLISLVRDLAAKGIAIPSPRRLKVMETIAKANAWLCGARQVGVEHLDVLTMVFPHDPDEQAVVDEVVFKLAAPNRSSILTEMGKAAEALIEFNTADANSNDRERARGMSDAYTKVKRCAMTLADLDRNASAGDRPYIDKVWPTLTQMHERFVSMIQPGGDVGDFRQLALDGKLVLR